MRYTISIPAYKSTFLNECIDSVLCQTYNDFELIILNDASPENIDDIISKYNDSRIRYYKNKFNVGAVDVVDNWNKCLEYAKGNYIICMGDDDKLAPNCLEEYNKLIDKYPNLDIYHARTLMIDENSNICDIQEDRPDFESVYSLIWHRTFKNRIQFIGDFLYRVVSLRNVGGFYKIPLAWESDYISSFVAASTFGIANLHEPTFYYRRNSQSITNSNTTRLKMEDTLKYKEWLYLFLEKEPINEIDKYYRILLKKDAGNRILHNEIFMISYDLSISYMKGFIYWIKRIKRFNISYQQFFYSCILGIGMKMRKGKI